LDIGFFQSEILSYLEEKVMDYVVTVKFTHPIQRLKHDCKNWVVLDELKSVNKHIKANPGKSHEV